MQEKSHLRIRILAVVGSTLACAGLACSTSADAPTTNGVNDVAKACAIAAEWGNPRSQLCNDCVLAAKLPKCDCSDLEYAGKCSEQESTLSKEPSCDAATKCAQACASRDCACFEGCYAGTACRDLASARDGCITAVCDSKCR